MTQIRKLVSAQITPVGDDEVDVVMSTAALARDGHILVPQGCRLDNYRANPIVLWSHDPNFPIGNSENIQIGNDEITARVRFAPIGISPKADEIRGLMKAGVVRAVSVAFDPIEGEPLDPKKPRGGQRFTQWELLELSPVSVPSDTGAMVTARANGDESMAQANQDLVAGDDTIAAAEGQDSHAQRARPAKARTRRASGARFGKPTFTRGLYEVASLCYLFSSLGYQLEEAKWEAAIEGDASQVPAMLAGVLSDLGDALLAMTAEEIAEALARHEIEAEAAETDDILVVEERAHIAAATTEGVRAFRRGLAHAKLRAGKTLSDDTVRCLREAAACHDDAMALHRSAIKKHREGLAAVNDMMDRAGVSDPDNETLQTTQTSSGTGVDEGVEGQRGADISRRRRQADLLALSATH
jgi:HK97 family phage prohead protease